jgi:biotin-(acetyl-CoA carboxylase) ligase
MKIGDDVRRFERCSMSLASAANRPVDKDDLLRLLCESLETWYNIFIRGTGDKIVHAFQEKMTFTPGDCVCLETGGAAADGTFIGLDAFGGLVCENGGRRTAHDSAEVRALERG